MDSKYVHRPQRNVANTDVGMQFVLAGAIKDQ